MITFMFGKMNSRGQITIPIELRRKLGWSAHTRLIFSDEGDHLMVMTLAQYVHSLRGKYKGMGLMQTLREDRTREAER